MLGVKAAHGSIWEQGSVQQEILKGLSRFQVLDSNWKVCAQLPAAGKKVGVSTVVTLSSVKLTEKC
jgi:hypothetical protein